jgi:hypothetical protein
MQICHSGQWPSIVEAVAAASQVVTAIVIVLLTRRLANATETYAALTKAAVDLNAKQHEGDVHPMWHVTIVPSTAAENEVWMTIYNLCKASARVTYVLIRVESEDEQTPHEFVLNVGLPGFRESISNIKDFILQSLASHIVNREWTGILEISIVFMLWDSQAQIPSEPFRFKVTIRDGRITSAHPRLPGISVEPRGGDPQ